MGRRRHGQRGATTTPIRGRRRQTPSGARGVCLHSIDDARYVLGMTVADLILARLPG